MENQNLLNELQNFLTEERWREACEDHSGKETTLGKVLSELDFHEGGWVCKQNEDNFVVSGDNGLREFDLFDALRLVLSK